MGIRLRLRPHFLWIFRNIARYIFILLLPCFRLLVIYKWDIYVWFQYVWIDLLAILVCIVFGAVSYSRTVLSTDGRTLDLYTGILRRKRYTLSASEICSVSVKEPILFKPLGYRSVYVYYGAEKNKKSRFHIGLSGVNTEHLLSSLKLSCIDNVKCWSFKDILCFSLFFSSSPSGAVFLSTAVYNLSKVFGSDFKNLIFEHFLSTSVSSLYIKPMAAIFALIFILSWIISFLITLIRYTFFSVSHENRLVSVRHGVLDKSCHILKYDAILCIQRVWTGLSFSFSISSDFIICDGYRKEKNSLPVLRPLSRPWPFIFASSEKPVYSVYADRGGIFPYIRTPIIVIAVSYILVLIFESYIPVFYESISVLFIFIFIYSLWRIYFGFLANRKTKAIVYGNCVLLGTSKKAYLLDIWIPLGKISAVRLRQSIIGKIRKRCFLDVYLKGRKRTKYTLRNIKEKDAIKLLSLLSEGGIS